MYSDAFSHFDAQAALGFVNQARTYIEPGVYEIVYGDIQYQDLVPVDYSAPEFSKTITYYSADGYGKAGFVNGNSDHIPLAGSELNKSEMMVHTTAIGYSFGWEEVGAAMQSGIPLKDNDARVARRASEELTDDVAFYGDARKGLTGLINSTAVTAANATTGNWGAATSDQIMGDVNQALTGVASTVLYTRRAMADTLLLPYAKLTLLSQKFATPGDKTTLLSHIKENNVYTAITGRPLTIKGVRGLETAGVGVTQRMVAYRRSPEVLKMHIPMAFRFLQGWQRGPLTWEVPGVQRLSGVEFKLPKEARYIDGI